MDAYCPACGSQNVCQDFITLRPVKTYGWGCDDCEYTWDVEPVTTDPQPGE